MKPFIHAQNSVKKFGGKPEDYLAIHDFFDQTKSHFPDMRHRAILHTSFGIFLCERIFGVNITNSDGKLVSVRDIGEQHVTEDFRGFIPTIQDFLVSMKFEPWMENGKVAPPSVNPSEKRTEEPKQILNPIIKIDDVVVFPTTTPPPPQIWPPYDEKFGPYVAPPWDDSKGPRPTIID